MVLCAPSTAIHHPPSSTCLMAPPTYSPIHPSIHHLAQIHHLTSTHPSTDPSTHPSISLIHSSMLPLTGHHSSIHPLQFILCNFFHNFFNLCSIHHPPTPKFIHSLTHLSIHPSTIDTCPSSMQYINLFIHPPSR